MTENTKPFKAADITTPVASGRTRLALRTSMSGGGGSDAEALRVPDGTTWDVKDGYARVLLAEDAGVEFHPAVVLAGLMKSAGIEGAQLRTKHLSGLPSAMRSAKIKQVAAK